MVVNQENCIRFAYHGIVKMGGKGGEAMLLDRIIGLRKQKSGPYNIPQINWG